MTDRWPMIGTLYDNCMDQNTRDALGGSPLIPYFFFFSFLFFYSWRETRSSPPSSYPFAYNYFLYFFLWSFEGWFGMNFTVVIFRIYKISNPRHDTRWVNDDLTIEIPQFLLLSSLLSLLSHHYRIFIHSPIPPPSTCWELERDFWE